ncbi:MAG TPA: FAD-binding protein [Candidatus Aminicenantes bacterium]|nr:FAD-dependent oxidoreductase [Candidatus Aminicenantes bacterium]HDT14073.1 FAD-binding protein [Candidatus Aminicenantes bacterium]
MELRDAIVIGAGPAGLTAGANLARFGLKTTILEEKVAGGYAAEIPLLENYPGCVGGRTGKDIVDKMVQQCADAGTEIRQLEKVVGLIFGTQAHTVTSEKAVYAAPAILLASGRHIRTLGVPGEREFHGKGVSYCAVCDGFFFRDKDVFVVGNDSRAAEVALFLARSASRVKLVCQKERLCAEKILIDGCENQNIEILANMELVEIKGDAKVRSVVLADMVTRASREIDADGVFVQLEGVPNSDLARASGVKVDGDGYIIIDSKARTNIARVYAAGDVTVSPAKLIVSAVAQAIGAALDIVEHVHRAA